MSTKHTPGPWRAAPHTSSAYGRMIVETTDADGFAQMVAVIIEPADARLIAAAPDLLAALRMIADSDACAINAKAIAASAIAIAVQS